VESSNARAGDLLKQGRLKQRLSTSECARRTHIALRYLEALEENRWSDLPSESHRRGFLTLYARFLGVSADEVMQLYREEKEPPTAPAATVVAPAATVPQRPAQPRSRRVGFTMTPMQLVGVLILILVSTWGAYHLLKSDRAEATAAAALVHQHPLTLETRLPAAHPVSRVQKIRIHADATTWLRVTTAQKLLFEGLLPAQSDKEWAGNGPFFIKMADAQALHVYWNDQPVDVAAGAHGRVNSIQLPLTH